MAKENETIADIIAKVRKQAKLERKNADRLQKRGDDANYGIGCSIEEDANYLESIADRLEAAYKREAQSIERIVRDAIIDYNEMYQSAPNDEAERDLRERAARANAWLKQHGFEEEPFHWSKEETPCL